MPTKLIATLHWTGARASRSNWGATALVVPPSIVRHIPPAPRRECLPSVLVWKSKSTLSRDLSWQFHAHTVKADTRPFCFQGQAVGRAVAQLFSRTSHKALTPWDYWGLCWMEEFHLCMRLPENCSGWLAANNHLQCCSALPQHSPKREEHLSTANAFPDTCASVQFEVLLFI